VLLELGLEALEEGEGVGGAASEPGDDVALADAPHLLRGVLHDRFVEADLPVTSDDDLRLATHTEDGGAMEHGLRV
jgi:hypothetical protein